MVWLDVLVDVVLFYFMYDVLWCFEVIVNILCYFKFGVCVVVIGL